MSLFTKKFLLLSVLALLFVHDAFGVGVNVFSDGRVSVNVTNSLEDNLDLNLHCRSKGKDLGAHSLHHGESFGWKVGILEDMYYCSFQWNGSRLFYYDIYLASRDGVSNNLNWYIKKSGPCKVVSPGKDDCYSWGK